MLSIFAKILGAVFLLIGILGFIPQTAPDGMLLGIFMVDTTHNIIHILSGIVLLAVGLSDNFDLIRRVVLGFAIIYGLVTVLGFLAPDGSEILGMHMNMADNILHLVITVAALMFALPQRYPRTHT